MHSFVNILRQPDLVRAFSLDGQVALDQTAPGVWEGAGATIALAVTSDKAQITLTGGHQITRIQFRWHGDLRGVKRYLGDHWERSYADMEWRGEVPGRAMPWYFMAYDGKRTDAYGVETNPGAFTFWTADSQGISLWTDVRSGGVAVNLGSRTLAVATVRCREGLEAETPFQATAAFCKQLCPHPRLPKVPLYGTNDWNYAYGNNSADLIAGVSALISELSPNAENRPYAVIDEGWQMGPYEGRFGYGPWVGNPRFGDMGEFAQRLKSLDVNPGIWIRPLTPLPESPESWRLQRDREYLDPTVPDVKEHVASHIRRLVGWGYEMIKHDFTTFDTYGLWGSQMGSSPTADGWELYDGSKTNAEVLTDLYATIREAAGEETRLIGCNTMSHLAAGYHELQRTGDDTSGKCWNRNRRMGVNTLAFRAAQQGAFYQVDPDIVSITNAISWDLVSQWLRLVSESGTALFVAIEPSAVEPKHRVALRHALDLASRPQVVAEPLDWLDTDCPRKWRLLGEEVEFAWMDTDGAWPFADW